MNKKALEALAQACQSAIGQAGYELVDLENVQEEGRNILRFYIYKEGGVDLNDCELVSGILDPLLDELDPLPGSYYLEVSSPDLSRPLKTDRDLERNLGEKLELSFYQKHEGKKKMIGRLVAFDDEYLQLDCQGTEEKVARKDLSKVTVAIDF
jgi:ribosome maturation factor RimP